MLSIPPFRFSLAKYHQNFTARLSRLPPTTKLRTITTLDPAAYHHLSHPIFTPLTSLLPTTFPPIFIPTHVTWTHPRVSNYLTTTPSTNLVSDITAIMNNPP